MNFEVLIPIIAVSIPLAVVVGVFIVKPIAAALGQATAKSVDDPRLGQLVARLEATQERLERVERKLDRVEEAQDFNRQLSRPAGGPLPPPSTGA